MSGLKNILKDVHRRSLWQVLGIYLAGSWIALQVVQTVVETANLPQWLPGMAIVLLVIGFPIVMATAVLQTSSPSSDRTRPDVEFGESWGAGDPGSAAHKLFTWRNAVIGGGAAFALWGVVATGLLLTGRGVAAGGAEPDGRASIAVLPFTSMGGGDESETFSVGIHDDLLTRLSKVKSLRVISRTSVMRYKDTQKSIPEIGDELGVATILEGSVLSAGGQINFNAQLIDADSDEHLWAETYNRALTLENIFALQRELAERIAGALSATLLPEEASEIETPPTDDLEAYNYYLQGNKYFNLGPRSEDFEISFQMYQRAVELDPSFALAYAKMALAYGQLYQGGGERTQEVLDKAREAVDRAFQFDPDLAEAHLALGQWYYAGYRDYDRAMDHLNRAQAANLQSVDLFHLLGAVQRRKADFAGSIASFEEMVRLDPLSAHFAEDLGTTYWRIGEYEKAEAEFERAISLAPNLISAYDWKADLYYTWDGDTRRARETLARTDTTQGGPQWQLYLFDLADGDFEQALKRRPAQNDHFWRARALSLMGRQDEARAFYDSSLVEALPDLEENPDDMGLRFEVAFAHAALGRVEDAIREAEEAARRWPASRDALAGPRALFSLAQIYTIVGEHDRAVDTLEELLHQSPGYTRARLRIDPLLRPLHGNPRFMALTGDG